LGVPLELEPKHVTPYHLDSGPSELAMQCQRSSIGVAGGVADSCVALDSTCPSSENALPWAQALRLLARCPKRKV
jgi:hypothetical protein